MSNQKRAAKRQAQKNQNLRTTVLVIVLAVLILAAVVVAVVLLSNAGRGNQGDNDRQIERTNEELFAFEIPGFTLIEDAEIGEVNEQLRVLGVGRYTGAYMEDGSDEEVMDVLAVVVQNVSDRWVVNADLTVDCGGRSAAFSVSALPGMSCALLLEQNRLAYTEGMTLRSPACGFCADQMDGLMVDFGADFSLQPYEGDILVLRNISGQEIAEDALLYYKNVASYGKNGEMIFLGGIAYSTRFQGPIAAGEERQVKPTHYSLNGSAILYMSYDK